MPDSWDLAAQGSSPKVSGGDSWDHAAAGASTFDQFMEAAKGNDVEVPLTSHGAATKQGVLNTVEGISQGVQSVASAVAHPINTLANIGDVATLGLTHLLPGADKASGGETVSGVANLPGQAAELVKNPPDLSEVGKAAGLSGGQILGSVGTGKALSTVAQVPFAAARAIRATKTLADIPKALGADATSTLATVADREGLPPLQSETVREASTELSKSFIDRAKQQYGVVDKAVGGDLKPVQEKITALKKAIRVNANTNPDLADKYVDQLAEQQRTLADLVQKAKANGVANAENLMKAGDTDYFKGKAMEKVAARIKTSAGEAKTGGHPDPASFANQIDLLNNKGILVQALGPEGAEALVKTAREGLANARQAKTIASTPGVETAVKLTKGVKAVARLPK